MWWDNIIKPSYSKKGQEKNLLGTFKSYPVVGIKLIMQNTSRGLEGIIER